MLEHSVDLPPCDSGEPLQKIVHGSAIFEILEERFDWDPSACKRPGAADPVGCTLHRIARVPIKHQSNGIASFPLGQAPARAR
jgi:hypothetical protein